MTIPSQNEFLLPFLTLLKDGETLTRSQMMFRLAKHFDISEEDAQAMSGNQFTLVSRVAWCVMCIREVAGCVHRPARGQVVCTEARHSGRD